MERNTEKNLSVAEVAIEKPAGVLTRLRDRMRPSRSDAGDTETSTAYHHPAAMAITAYLKGEVDGSALAPYADTDAAGQINWRETDEHRRELDELPVVSRAGR